MKQAVVTIKYEEEKLNAIKQYMGKKDADFESDVYKRQDTRYTGPVEVAQTITSALGTGGNNTPLAVNKEPFCCLLYTSLTHDFKQAELQRLKAKAAKIPPKIRVYSFAMLMCFLATYFAIIIYEIIKSMGTLF